MAANGPALDQRIVVYQGAGATYVVPIRDPDGARPDLSTATAAWWVGPAPIVRPGTPATIGNGPGTHVKALALAADGAGGFQVVLPIAPADLAGFAPGGLWQHEIWITEAGREPYPACIGPLVILGTVKGAAA